MQQFLEQPIPKQVQESNQNVQYIEDREQGIQYEYHDKKLVNVYLYGNHDRTYKPYNQQLPFDIYMNMTNEDVVSKFGEPSNKEGGNYMNIGLSYDHLGIEFVFNSKQWIQSNLVIDYIILYNPKSEVYCGVCKKKANSRCSRCKLINYCGRECQTIHWKAHRKYCN
ncbi:hypothetical protein pb186bvf_019669 [Paramecium bursaria]